MPEYITKLGPYVIDQQEKDNQIIATYEFDESKFAEAWEYISEQLDAFCIIPDFSFQFLFWIRTERLNGTELS